MRAVKWKILIHISVEKYFVWVGGKWPLCSTCASISGSQLFGHLTISLVICRWSTTSTPIAPSGITLRGVWWVTGPPKAANSWTPIKHTPPAHAAILPTSPSSWHTVKSQYVMVFWSSFSFILKFSTKLKPTFFLAPENKKKLESELFALKLKYKFYICLLNIKLKETKKQNEILNEKNISFGRYGRCFCDRFCFILCPIRNISGLFFKFILHRDETIYVMLSFGFSRWCMNLFIY